MSLWPRMRQRINRAHLLPFRWVFANFSPLEYPLQLFSYFCGSAAWTAVVVIGRPFLPVHWCTNSSHWINCLFSVSTQSDGKIFDSCAPTPQALRHCANTICTGNSLALNVPVNSQVVSFMSSQSQGLTDVLTHLSKIRPVEQGRALYRSSFLRYIIVFYLVRAWNYIGII
jgi:hypothetical protein